MAFTASNLLELAAMKYLRAIFFSIAISFVSCHAIAQNHNEVIGKVLYISSSVNISGENFIYSEVKIINKSKLPISIFSANVKTKTDKYLYNKSNEQLEKLSSINSRDLPVGDSCIFYFDIPHKQLENGEPLLFVFDYNDSLGKTLKLTLVATFSAQKPTVLAAPLNGKNWVAIYNSEWQRGHRRVYYTVEGQSRIPGRFAIDFVKLDDEGKLCRQQPEVVTNYYSYDEDVLAVEDGTVVSLRNDFKESKTISGNQSHTENDASGNYLILEIGYDLYACYEHLKPGSIPFKVGDKVNRGDVIAKVGFTGDASEPHLHFHVADKNSVLGAEGLPFVFKQFSYEGIYDDFSSFGKQRWKSLNKTEIRRFLPSRPLQNSVINFPN
ncbi:peptidoglycan DD-metalloendopeptidase family protein [Flavobacterium sp. NST-5]|uniref:Peptidoglycan DD-metalloendopeptidase family protein n=1 Tax=Flavobacterium ichthyis TaxID=2698827 RepID=A0ABW9ZA65_9FLAO|nr:M23 family metallopeptidase [Flavobacterium ichthyis]NBL65596.1 peptidoglycan DD-metalloendopeptidase family protein [Flavobacterium ichthyis]